MLVLTCKVGWCYYRSVDDIIGFEPEILQPIKGIAKLCPAVNNVFKNAYILRSPFDIQLHFNGFVDGETSIELIKSGSSVTDEKLLDVISIHTSKEQIFQDKPLLEFLINMVFVTDTKGIEIEQLPPFLEYRPDNYPVVFSSVRFNIYNWERPMQLALSWMDVTKDITIKRGDPLCYIRFNKDIKLEQIPLKPDLKKHIVNNLSAQHFLGGYSDYIMRRAGLSRKHKWLS